MKKTPYLAAASILALLALSRVATSGVFDTTAIDVKNIGVLTEAGDSAPTPETSIFDTLVPVSGKITEITATAVGNYVCKDGAIKFTPAGLGLVRAIATRTSKDTSKDTTARELTEDTSGLEAVRGAPVKLTVGGKTVLIPAMEAERFKAVMSIVHAAKLTNRDVSIQAAAVPNCANAFYAADITFN